MHTASFSFIRHNTRALIQRDCIKRNAFFLECSVDFSKMLFLSFHFENIVVAWLNIVADSYIFPFYYSIFFIVCFCFCCRRNLRCVLLFELTFHHVYKRIRCVSVFLSAFFHSLGRADALSAFFLSFIFKCFVVHSICQQYRWNVKKNSCSNSQLVCAGRCTAKSSNDGYDVGMFFSLFVSFNFV